MPRSREMARGKKDPAVKAARKERQKAAKAAKKANKAQMNGGGDGGGAGPSAYTADQLLEKAETLLAELAFDAAEKFCRRALELEPEREEALTGLGEILLEAGKGAEALEHLRKAIALKPDGGSYSKFLYLAQLSEGKEAEGLYLKGLEVMKADGESPEDVSGIFCALAELYLTDLCDEENAEARCAEFCDEAAAADPTNPAAAQTRANFLVSAERMDEAKAAIEASVALWLPQLQAQLDPDNREEVHVEMRLDFDKRKECARLCIETEAFETAESVLDLLLAEEEKDLEIWYLYGLLSKMRGGDEFAPQAKAFFTAVQEMSGSLEEEERSEMSEMLAQVAVFLEELKDAPDPAPEEGEEAELPMEDDDS